MNSAIILSLSYVQQDKIIELCREFFPAYTDFHLANCSIQDKSYLDFQRFEYITMTATVNERLHAQCMHWYQLCMHEIPDRIIRKMNKIKPTSFHPNDIRIMIITKDTHPLDALVSIINDLKKENLLK